MTTARRARTSAPPGRGSDDMEMVLVILTPLSREAPSAFLMCKMLYGHERCDPRHRRPKIPARSLIGNQGIPRFGRLHQGPRNLLAPCLGATEQADATPYGLRAGPAELPGHGGVYPARPTESSFNPSDRRQLVRHRKQRDKFSSPPIVGPPAFQKRARRRQKSDLPHIVAAIDDNPQRS